MLTNSLASVLTVEMYRLLLFKVGDSLTTSATVRFSEFSLFHLDH